LSAPAVYLQKDAWLASEFIDRCQELLEQTTEAYMAQKLALAIFVVDPESELIQEHADLDLSTRPSAVFKFGSTVLLSESTKSFLLYRTGNLSAAEEVANLEVNRGFENSRAYAYGVLAMCHQRQGRHREALEALHQAASLIRKSESEPIFGEEHNLLQSQIIYAQARAEVFGFGY
jgi:tetratricopeptide (TPR) repeat protein